MLKPKSWISAKYKTVPNTWSRTSLHLGKSLKQAPSKYQFEKKPIHSCFSSRWTLMRGETGSSSGPARPRSRAPPSGTTYSYSGTGSPPRTSARGTTSASEIIILREYYMSSKYKSCVVHKNRIFHSILRFFFSLGFDGSSNNCCVNAMASYNDSLGLKNYVFGYLTDFYCFLFTAWIPLSLS